MSIPWWLLLADGLAVVLGASPRIDGCGFVSHALHMDGAPASVSSEAGDFVVLGLYASPVAPTPIRHFQKFNGYSSMIARLGEA